MRKRDIVEVFGDEINNSPPKKNNETNKPKVKYTDEIWL